MLNDEQKAIVEETGNILVTACPGSGKTRVLTFKIVHELAKILDKKQYIIALTFTNRAADEILKRIDEQGIENKQFWAGTIHSFCLEWILRPYAGYCSQIKDGFTIIDEDTKENLLRNIKRRYRIRETLPISTRLDREGMVHSSSEEIRRVVSEYHEELKQEKLIDFDLILYLSYRLLRDNPHIAITLSKVLRLICVDEYQDTQDLQYGILGEIIRAGNGESNIFFVGDPDQAIYVSLGGMAKTKEEIQQEIGGFEIKERTLSGNYRSSQRIINYYRHFQITNIEIQALGENRDKRGLITLNNTVNFGQVHVEIAQLIEASLRNGVPESEICVIAPRWVFLYHLARQLKNLLPGVNFDAPGLSPIPRWQDNVWYKVARLFLTEPSPNMYATRIRWANEVFKHLSTYSEGLMVESHNTGKQILRIVNSINPQEEDGVLYLRSAFQDLLLQLGIKLSASDVLSEELDVFIKAIESRRNNEYFSGLSWDVNSFKKMFKEAQGVVINTCQGVKGEEFDTVIAFGLLRGFIPHWEEINQGRVTEILESKKMLYVIGSRAKQNLHLIAETGRTHRNGPYFINEQLTQVVFDYD